MESVIGRKKEVAELEKLYYSGRPEFLAVYGRRRVGKTYLINTVFEGRMTFHHTGMSPYDGKRKVTLRDQLLNFQLSLIKHGAENTSLPKSWLEAFYMLQCFLEKNSDGSRQVVFIDELPWLDTVRSSFVIALEAFWNGWGSTRKNLMFIVCGSATSWILDNIINNKGGLYGRLTWEMKLLPFTLKDCEEFYASRGIKMSRYNVVQSYMFFGGIPFYMNYLKPEYSLAQNIDNLFFASDAKLDDEFNRLFNSVFDKADSCIKIVKALANRHSGYTRGELSQMTGINQNGDFTVLLKSLISSGFVKSYVPFGYSQRQVHYKLTDNFCWFWLHFKEKKRVAETDYWERHLNESEIAAWRGIAFEEICFTHIEQIKKALGITGVSSTESAYIAQNQPSDDGMQIDMVINRADDVVNLCEMKFYKDKISIDKAYSETLVHRQTIFEQKYPKKTVHLTLVSATDVVRNEYSDVLQSKVTIDDLFD